MQNVVILGSTGSLGVQTIEVLDKYQKHFRIVGLSANKNTKLLKSQAKKFKVKTAVLASKDGAKAIKALATLPSADIIINVISGLAGTAPTIAALKAHKTLIQANKESIVAKGKKIMELAKASPKKPAIIPLDSEHNAIFEILKRYPGKKIKRIILPCSGGPFWNWSIKQIKNATTADALNHPKWKMGPKISLESATLVNKGMEIIEAHYLFGLPLSKIKVVMHPECIVHGMVEFEGMALPIAYLSTPDMREHIENALLEAILDKINGSPRQIRPLKPNEFYFQRCNHKKFPGMRTVVDAFKKTK